MRPGGKPADGGGSHRFNAKSGPAAQRSSGNSIAVLGGGIVGGFCVPRGRTAWDRQVDAAVAGGPSVGGRRDREKFLYVTSEESAQQIAMRPAARSRIRKICWCWPRPMSRRIIHQINCRFIPDVVIVDSVQMIYKPNLPAAPGSGHAAAQGLLHGPGLAWLKPAASP